MHSGPKKKHRRIYVRPRLAAVGIGVSASGFNPAKRLFDAMPADSGGGFLLIRHCDFTHTSFIGDLLGRHSSALVVEA